MRNLLPIVVLMSLLAACGTEAPGAFDSDTDELSSATYSMAQVRADPSLAPDVVVPPGRHVIGHARPSSADLLNPNDLVVHRPNPWADATWLYDANQLGQFLTLTDPAVYPSDKKDATYSRKPGDLFADEGKLVWDNIEQGALGDCYFIASFVSVIFSDQGGALTKNLIVPHKSGTKVVAYDVNFFQANGRKVRIEVDPDLLHDSSDNIYYAQSTKDQPGAEEWAPSLVEKAYASWHKTYKAIGDGGTAADAIFALTGKKTVAALATDADIVTKIESAGKNHKPQVACTWGEHDGVDYTNTGIYADHCYTLRGIRRAGSNVFVLLRNPWGPTTSTTFPSEPPTDGVQDGIFELPLSTFQKLYDDVTIVP